MPTTLSPELGLFALRQADKLTYPWISWAAATASSASRARATTTLETAMMVLGCWAVSLSTN